jgi:hypothetical protein
MYEQIEGTESGRSRVNRLLIGRRNHCVRDDCSKLQVPHSIVLEHAFNLSVNLILGHHSRCNAAALDIRNNYVVVTLLEMQL